MRNPPYLRATGHHLSYGITQCYLPPDTSERAPSNPCQISWYSLNLPRRDGRLSLRDLGGWLLSYWDGLPTRGGYPSTNRARRRVFYMYVDRDPLVARPAEWFCVRVKSGSQMEDKARELERDIKIDELFEHWNHDASGVIDMDFLECTLTRYKPAPLTDTIALGTLWVMSYSE